MDRPDPFEGVPGITSDDVWSHEDAARKTHRAAADELPSPPEINVLCVDDEDLSRYVIATQLRLCGYEGGYIAWAPRRMRARARVRGRVGANAR